MDRRFEARREELLAQACVSVKDWAAVVARLEAFVEPFVESLTEAAQRRHLVEYSSGLLSSLERKTGEGIADLHGQDRKPMPQFVGESPWEHAPLLMELARQVAARIGEADGVIVFDPLSFRSKTGLREEGHEVGRRRAAMERSPGPGRQLSGRDLPGIRVASGTGVGQRAAVPSRRVDEGPCAVSRGGSSAAREVSNPARPGAGDARRKRSVAAARLDRGRR